MTHNSISLLLTLLLFPFVHSSQNHTIDSLNTFLQDLAFKALIQHGPHTGIPHKATLPSNLSGIEISIVRLRSRRLWSKGANFSYFHIPSRTITLPHVRRLAIVYQNLGNRSSYYYNISGYSLVTSVVGFTVFDATNLTAKNITNLRLESTMGKPITVKFPNLGFLDEKVMSRTRCVEFYANGSFYMGEMRMRGVCGCGNGSRFSIVVRSERKKETRWYVWVIGVVLGLSGMVVVGYEGMVLMRVLKTKKIQVMERQADEDLVLESRWIGDASKMPSAAVTRTLPVLETPSFWS